MRNLLKVPVLLIAFNRPQYLEKQLEVLREANVTTLYVCTDGPRAGNKNDEYACKQVREIIDNKVSWPCEIIKNYSNVNIGCAARVSSGINWVFEHVDSAIILEDDCTPNLSFFRYAEELLNLYAEDERIFSICARNFERLSTQNDYIFSRYLNIWGWATWRRAWKYYDFNLDSLNSQTEKILANKIESWKARYLWLSRFYYLKSAKIKYTWDFQWVYSSLINDALSVLPKVNLVENIGFNNSGTHTIDKNRIDLEKKNKVEDLKFPLSHPISVSCDFNYDLGVEIQDVSYEPLYRIMLGYFKNKLLAK